MPNDKEERNADKKKAVKQICSSCNGNDSQPIVERTPVKLIRYGEYCK